jgi:hypothetical protein
VFGQNLLTSLRPSQRTLTERSTSTVVSKSIPQPKAIPKARKPLQKQITPDNRLFVRLPNDSPARDMQGYAVLTRLRASLGADSSHLKDVQATKTGFALCPASPASLIALEARSDVISEFSKNCPIERSARWVSYRIINVPGMVGQITDSSNSLVPVVAQAVAHAVHEATTLTPTSIAETTYSISNPHLLYSSWFVNFP